MANFFTLHDGNLTDTLIYGYSLSGAEKMDSTTGVLLSTIPLSSNDYTSTGSTLSAIAVHLSARADNPTGTLGLVVNVFNSTKTTLKRRINETYAISSFTGHDGSNNLLTNYPQNWQILKLTTPLTSINTDVINYSLSTSNSNQLSLMGTVVGGNVVNFDKALLTNPTLSTFNLNATESFTVLNSNTPYGSPYYGLSSILFNGASYYKIDTNSIFRPEQGQDFTIEFWVNFNSISPNATHGLPILGYYTDALPSPANNIVWDVRLNSSRLFNLNVFNTTQQTLNTGVSAIINTWYHIAICSYNRSITFYINGIAYGSVPNTNVFTNITTAALNIGRYNVTGGTVADIRLNALIYNFKYIKGNALYVSNFSPSYTNTSFAINTVNVNSNVWRSGANRPVPCTTGLTLDNCHIVSSLVGLSTQSRIINANTFNLNRLFIHNQGTLNFPLSNSTNLSINDSNGIQITSDGTLNIGSSSSPVPLSTTHTITLSNNQIDVHSGGNFNVYGYPKLAYTSLVSDTVSGSRTFTTTDSISSVWRMGDTLVFKPNLSSVRGFDTLTIASFTGSNTLSTLSSSIFMHTGSTTYAFIPTVINLNKNVKLQGLNSTIGGTIRTINAAKTNINNAELNNFGINVSNKNGFIIGNNSSGSTKISASSIIPLSTLRSSTSILPLTNRPFQNTTINDNIINIGVLGLSSLSTNNVNISNNLILSSNAIGLQITNLSGSINMSNNITIGSLNYGTYIANNNLTGAYGCINYNSTQQGMMVSGTNAGTIVGGGLNSLREGVYVDTTTNNLSNIVFQNILASNNASFGFVLSGNTLNYLNPLMLNINGFSASNNRSFGFEGYNISGNLSSLTLNENISGGIRTSIGNRTTTINGLTSILSSVPLNILSGYNYGTFSIVNSLLSSNSSVGINLDSTIFSKFSIENSTISASTPIQLNSTRNRVEGSYLFNNTFLGSINFINLSRYQSNVYKTAGFAFTNYNKIIGNHFTYLPTGIKARDTVLYDSDLSDLVSERLAPISNTYKLCSSSKYVALNAGESTSIKVRILVSNTYNGNKPRLMVKRNPAAGIYSDTTLGYANTTNLNTFNSIIGDTTVQVIDNSVLEFYIDCDGTSGYVCVDTWTAN